MVIHCNQILMRVSVCLGPLSFVTTIFNYNLRGMYVVKGRFLLDVFSRGERVEDGMPAPYAVHTAHAFVLVSWWVEVDGGWRLMVGGD